MTRNIKTLDAILTAEIKSWAGLIDDKEFETVLKEISLKQIVQTSDYYSKITQLRKDAFEGYLPEFDQELNEKLDKKQYIYAFQDLSKLEGYAVNNSKLLSHVLIRQKKVYQAFTLNRIEQCQKLYDDVVTAEQKMKDGTHAELDISIESKLRLTRDMLCSINTTQKKYGFSLPDYYQELHDNIFTMAMSHEIKKAQVYLQQVEVQGEITSKLYPNLLASVAAFDVCKQNLEHIDYPPVYFQLKGILNN